MRNEKNTSKIILFSLEDINNAGEEILRSTTGYLVKSVCLSAECEQVQLLPKRMHVPFVYKFDLFLGNVIKWLSLKFAGNAIEYKLRNLAYRIQYTRYFSKKIRNSSSVVFTVGMLKYSTQNFSYVYYLINSIANRYHKPVMMSAMSIEKPDYNDWRYHQVVEAVNFDCVKVITTRDGSDGLLRLKNFYVKKENLILDIVGDPALWIPECYNVKKVEKSSVIGIGLIRKGIYKDYREENFSEEQVVDFYKDLIQCLIRRGIDFELFCNGMESDYEVGVQLVQDLGLSPEKLAPVPHSGKELAERISKYHAVFGARLHACITSVSLGVPVVGLLWDNKLEFFSQIMGIRQFFLKSFELSGDAVVNKLEEAVKYHFNFANRDFYKQKTKDSISAFFQEIKNDVL